MKFKQLLASYGASHNSDISSHLDTIYEETYKMNPKVIVELGVRGGESSRAFHYVNEEIDSNIIGVDIDECHYEGIIKNSKFVREDDCKYAETYKITYGSNIDVLMIDTSHYYEHTKEEIRLWFPLLRKKALVIFHDTHINGQAYVRKNGTSGSNWDNKRGVIRAIEEFFEKSYNETIDFEDELIKDDNIWKIKHTSICNGLTLCWKN
jgi:cephalosporin hydroxylase